MIGTRMESDDDHDDELEDLRNEARWQKQYFARLSRNPDCQDPDHPGCEDCEETDEEQT
jgi:hypothetical protein